MSKTEAKPLEWHVQTYGKKMTPAQARRVRKKARKGLVVEKD